MPDIWISGWTRMDLGPDGGPFDETKHPKGCMHTTEGTTLKGAEASYGRYPPHLGYDPQKRTKHQYVALNRHSYAFRGAETDDEYIIQVELVGFAARTHQWPTEVYRNIAEDVLQPLEDLVGITRQHLRFYRANEGIVLASKRSPIRLRPSALRNYSGWLGHQHVPGLADNGAVLADGDEHWDPGGFLMDTAFSFMRDVNKESDMLILAQKANSKEIWIGDGIHRRHVADMTEVKGLQHWMKENGHDNDIKEGWVDLRVLGIDVTEVSGGPVPGEPK